jgi:hypothetical protein
MKYGEKTPQPPEDKNGKPLQGQALLYWQRRQAWIQEADRAREAIEALAKGFCILAARLERETAPRAVAAIFAAAGEDPALALRVLYAAGLDPEPQRLAWEGERTVRQTSSDPGLFTSDPEHHPDAVRALRGGYVTDEDGNMTWLPGSVAAWNLKVKELRAARAQEQAERSAQSRVLWTDARTGHAVMDDAPYRPQTGTTDWSRYPEPAALAQAAEARDEFEVQSLRRSQADLEKQAADEARAQAQAIADSIIERQGAAS